MYPMLCKMADEQKNVTFVKLNCNKYNKELGKQLGAQTAFRSPDVLHCMDLHNSLL
jgi:hypothetical protein